MLKSKKEVILISPTKTAKIRTLETLDHSEQILPRTVAEAVAGLEIYVKTADIQLKADLDTVTKKVKMEQLPPLDYVPITEKGKASGVATLDSAGQILATQLPAMDYDPAGSADAVDTKLDAHTKGKENPHEVTAAQVGAIPVTQKGVANGVATLDDTGKIPADQLPVADDGPDGPPPVIGSIKFSAAADVGSEWLLCDGKFINDVDYPELVTVLGKHTPGVESFKEVLGESTVGLSSNCCLVNGTIWIYLVKRKTLVGVSDLGVKKEIPLTGVDSLLEMPHMDVVLSICGGSIYLAQNAKEASSFVLLEGAIFTGSESTISMVRLDILTKLTKVSTSSSVPSVTDISGMKYMVLGTSEASTMDSIVAIKWVSGSFSSSTLISYGFIARSKNQYDFVDLEKGKNALLTLLSFNHKNSNEFLVGSGYLAQGTVSGSSSIVVAFNIQSATQQVYGSILPPDKVITKHSFNSNSPQGMLVDKYWVRFVVDLSTPPLNVMPVAGDTEYLYRAELIDNQLQIEYGKYNPKTVFDWELVGPKLPVRSRLFMDSVVYCSAQQLWVIFVGTGILFSNSLAQGKWGYLDTQEVLGSITLFGSIDYDSLSNSILISGVDTVGIPKLGRLKFPPLYNYSNNGAWLPMISADGIPAYIKAKELPAIV